MTKQQRKILDEKAANVCAAIFTGKNCKGKTVIEIKVVGKPGHYLTWTFNEAYSYLDGIYDGRK